MVTHLINGWLGRPFPVAWHKCALCSAAASEGRATEQRTARSGRSLGQAMMKGKARGSASGGPSLQVKRFGEVEVAKGINFEVCGKGQAPTRRQSRTSPCNMPHSHLA
eukprot:EG_transcript_6301